MEAFPWALLAFLAANVAAALTGAFCPPGAWYQTLSKPSWTPPNWLFGPAWTVLYIMIAVAGWLAWRDAGPGGAVLPMAAYALQLLFNAFWSVAFFGLRRIGLALADAVAMALAIVACIAVFAPINALAAWLMVPYLLWVCFATALNLSILRRNSDVGTATEAA